MPKKESDVLPEFQNELFREVWQSLIDDGSIVPTGEMRPGPDGVLRPVYVAAVFAPKKEIH